MKCIPIHANDGVQGLEEEVSGSDSGVGRGNKVVGFRHTTNITPSPSRTAANPDSGYEEEHPSACPPPGLVLFLQFISIHRGEEPPPPRYRGIQGIIGSEIITADADLEVLSIHLPRASLAHREEKIAPQCAGVEANCVESGSAHVGGPFIHLLPGHRAEKLPLYVGLEVHWQEFKNLERYRWLSTHALTLYGLIVLINSLNNDMYRRFKPRNFVDQFSKYTQV